MKDDDDTLCYRSELEAAVKAAVEAEREECAKLCEDKNTLLAWPTYAAAIRARKD